MADFYDELAPLYHLLFEDWDASIRQQGQRLAAILRGEWPNHESVLDVSCGIGTQAIALAMQGYRVRGSDISKQAIERAKTEATARGQSIEFSVGDMRKAHVHHGTGYDLVISCDNSVPHLLSDREIALALETFASGLRRLLRPLNGDVRRRHVRPPLSADAL